MSSFFGGRNPFKDPFFTRPFDGMFGSSFFGPNGSPFTNMHPFVFPAHAPEFLEHPPPLVEHRPPLTNTHPFAFPAHAPEFLEHPSPFVEHQPLAPKRSRGAIIEELDFDDEKEAGKEMKENPRKISLKKKKENPRKHGSPFTNMYPPAFAAHAPAFLEHPPPYLEHQPLVPKRFRGPIIEQLEYDDEKEEAGKEKKENPRKHGRSCNGPFIQDPDDGVEAMSKHLQLRNDYGQYKVTRQQPQTHSYTFSSSTVTFGGADGAYYTSSKTRRTGSDGVKRMTFEESKEADTLTRQATHRVSLGLYDKGHSVTRKLNSDGKVDTMQALHNINEDEQSGFEEAWNRKARKLLPGWTGASSFGQNGLANQGRWALPSTEQTENMGRVMPDRPGALDLQHTGRKKN